MLLEDFDKNKNAVINPSHCIDKIEGFPKIGVACFSLKLFEEIMNTFPYEIIAFASSCNGKSPIVKINHKDKDIAVFLARVGAPACAASYEEIMEMGMEKLVIFGTCGVLDKNIDDCSIIIPTSAYRDEGTSYHYIPASDEIKVNSDESIKLFEDILNAHNFNYTKGKVWTTDGIYRETQDKVLKRKEQGCVCVDMECSAMSAVAKFREKPLFHFFYAADNLDNVQWDKRSLSCSAKLDAKLKIALLALEMAVSL